MSYLCVLEIQKESIKKTVESFFGAISFITEFMDSIPRSNVTSAAIFEELHNNPVGDFVPLKLIAQMRTIR